MIGCKCGGRDEEEWIDVKMKKKEWDVDMKKEWMRCGIFVVF